MMANLRSGALPASLLIPLALGAPKPTSIPGERGLFIALPAAQARANMSMEIEGHEFFSGDGRWIWYDLQTPRSEVFWLAGCELATGRRTWYHLERSEWSVHFNQSPDGTLFAGDGGGPSSVAAPGNGQWIYLFLRWIVFRSNMFGPTHVFAVEVNRR